MPRGHILCHAPCFQSVLHGDICAIFIFEHLTFKVLVLRCCTLDFIHANGFQSILHDDTKHLGICRSFESKMSGKRCEF